MAVENLLHPLWKVYFPSSVFHIKNVLIVLIVPVHLIQFYIEKTNFTHLANIDIKYSHHKITVTIFRGLVKGLQNWTKNIMTLKHRISIQLEEERQSICPTSCININPSSTRVHCQVPQQNRWIPPAHEDYSASGYTYTTD